MSALQAVAMHPAVQDSASLISSELQFKLPCSDMQVINMVHSLFVCVKPRLPQIMFSPKDAMQRTLHFN